MMEALTTLLEDGRPNFQAGGEIRSLDVKPGEVLVLKHPDGVSQKVLEGLSKWGRRITEEFGVRVILMSDALSLEKLNLGDVDVRESDAVESEEVTRESFERLKAAVAESSKGRRLIAQIDRWVSGIERRIETIEASGADCRDLLILRTEALGRIQEFRDGKMPYGEVSKWYETHKSR